MLHFGLTRQGCQPMVNYRNLANAQICMCHENIQVNISDRNYLIYYDRIILIFKTEVRKSSRSLLKCIQNVKMLVLIPLNYLLVFNTIESFCHRFYYGEVLVIATLERKFYKFF